MAEKKDGFFMWNLFWLKTHIYLGIYMNFITKKI